MPTIHLRGVLVTFHAHAVNRDKTPRRTNVHSYLQEGYSAPKFSRIDACSFVIDVAIDEMRISSSLARTAASEATAPFDPASDVIMDTVRVS